MNSANIHDSVTEITQFSIDAAFLVNKPGTAAIVVGLFQTQLTGCGVALANSKKELQEYVDNVG